MKQAELDILNKLFDAADHHAEDAGDPDHTVGDLQDLLRQAWGMMSIEQKRELLQSEPVGALVEAGARDEFEVSDLQGDLERSFCA